LGGAKHCRSKVPEIFFLNPDNGKGWVRTPPMDALVVKIDHFRARVMNNIAFLIIVFFSIYLYRYLSINHRYT
jgi:hypothetical protein